MGWTEGETWICANPAVCDLPRAAHFFTDFGQAHAAGWGGGETREVLVRYRIAEGDSYREPWQTPEKIVPVLDREDPSRRGKHR